jgi:hypothetical protein
VPSGGVLLDFHYDLIEGNQLFQQLHARILILLDGTADTQHAKAPADGIVDIKITKTSDMII